MNSRGGMLKQRDKLAFVFSLSYATPGLQYSYLFSQLVNSFKWFMPPGFSLCSDATLTCSRIYTAERIPAAAHIAPSAPGHSCSRPGHCSCPWKWDSGPPGSGWPHRDGGTGYGGDTLVPTFRWLRAGWSAVSMMPLMPSHPHQASSFRPTFRLQ